MQFASPRVRAKFSKYVGVQEWRNAVFLMFNVVCGNAYGNTFIDKGGACARLRVRRRSSWPGVRTVPAVELAGGLDVCVQAQRCV